TNHPVCAAAEERDLFIEAQPPLLENGGEWTRLATNPPSTPRRNLWDSSVANRIATTIPTEKCHPDRQWVIKRIQKRLLGKEPQRKSRKQFAYFQQGHSPN